MYIDNIVKFEVHHNQRLHSVIWTIIYYKGSLKKSSSNNCQAIERGKGWAIKEKNFKNFLKTKKKGLIAIKLEGRGGGVKALMAWPLEEELYFFGFPKYYAYYLQGKWKLLGSGQSSRNLRELYHRGKAFIQSQS